MKFKDLPQNAKVAASLQWKIGEFILNVDGTWMKSLENGHPGFEKFDTQTIKDGEDNFILLPETRPTYIELYEIMKEHLQ